MLTVYSKSGCPDCLRAVQYLERSNVEFMVVKVDEDAEALAKMKAEGHRTVPQIYQDGKLFVAGGYQGLIKMSFVDLKKGN